MKIYIYIFFIFLNKFLKCNIISFPFKRIFLSDLNETNFYSNYAYNRIYTYIKIGTPPYEIKIQIKMSQYSLCIKNDSIYNHNISKTYQENGEKITRYSNDYFSFIPSTESFILGKENIIIENLKFLLTENSNYNFEGILGLQIHENYDKIDGHGLISQLKSNKLINKEVFFFNFDKNDRNNGELIIGDYPHLIPEFKNEFPEFQFKLTSLHIPGFEINFNLKFRSIFWNGKEIEKESVSNINIESGYIIATKSFEEISKEFFIKNKCEKIIVNVIYYTYICDYSSKLNISDFSDINFYSSDANYNFTLSYKDIFMKNGSKIYFMIVFDIGGHNMYWILGNLFIKKNNLVFDMNRRIICFYDRRVENPKNVILNDKTMIYMIIIIVAGLIILGLFSFIIYKFLFKKKNKKVYELNEDYEYNTSLNN